MEKRYYVIDAFTRERFSGNPAAVVLDCEGLDDTSMQRIAAEFNLSETTFVLPSETDGRPAGLPADVRFRWFTPSVEVDMCGHATIAGVHALVESGIAQDMIVANDGILRVETKSGTLATKIEPLAQGSAEYVIWLELPRPTLTEWTPPVADFEEVLGLANDARLRDQPAMKTQDGDVIVLLTNTFALNSAKPDFVRLAALSDRVGVRGWCLATTDTLAPSISVQSRFFAPKFGIDEDAVTGSVHGPLAAHLVTTGLVTGGEGVVGLHCIQGKPGGRTGLVRAVVTGDQSHIESVWIGGEAVTVMTGVLSVEKPSAVSR